MLSSKPAASMVRNSQQSRGDIFEAARTRNEQNGGDPDEEEKESPSQLEQLRQQRMRNGGSDPLSASQKIAKYGLSSSNKGAAPTTVDQAAADSERVGGDFNAILGQKSSAALDNLADGVNDVEDEDEDSDDLF